MGCRWGGVGREWYVDRRRGQGRNYQRQAMGRVQWDGSDDFFFLSVLFFLSFSPFSSAFLPSALLYSVLSRRQPLAVLILSSSFVFSPVAARPSSASERSFERPISLLPTLSLSPHQSSLQRLDTMAADLTEDARIREVRSPILSLLFLLFLISPNCALTSSLNNATFPPLPTSDTPSRPPTTTHAPLSTPPRQIFDREMKTLCRTYGAESLPISYAEALKNVHLLKDKVVIVTGGSKGVFQSLLPSFSCRRLLIFRRTARTGLGKEYAVRAAKYGAKVVISARGQSAIDATVQEIEKEGGCVSPSLSVLLRS
jgi:hypothetical protein